MRIFTEENGRAKQRCMYQQKTGLGKVKFTATALYGLICAGQKIGETPDFHAALWIRGCNELVLVIPGIQKGDC